MIRYPNNGNTPIRIKSDGSIIVKKEENDRFELTSRNEVIYRERIHKNTIDKEKVCKGSMYKYVLFVLAGLVFSILVVHYVNLHALQQDIAGKVIRFHVLANSDSNQDQTLKLAVRDRVGTYLGEQLEGAADITESRQIISDNLEKIEEVAAEEIQEQGYDYTVSASLEETYFPWKTYGEASFPSGEYQALRVVIGDGEGKNWWCVLYPNLCFSGSLYQIDEENATEKLETVLSPEEYKLIMESKDYEISSRVLETIKGIFTNP